jgi:hypothetical protein
MKTMKTNNLLLPALFVSLFTISCTKDYTLPSLNEVVNPNVESVSTGAKGEANTDILLSSVSTTASCNASAYLITLEEVIHTGSTWEWIWSVQNPNPGNGNGGTVQNLSHWGMQLAACVNSASIVGAAYSPDNISWTNFIPIIAVDPSQGCFSAPVLKFDYGTTGGNKSYYKLIVNQVYTVGASVGYFKSGTRTGCCTFSFPGISCGGQFEE